MKETVQENIRRAQKVRSISIKWVKKLRSQCFHERATYQRKDETCRFNDRSILHEEEKTSKPTAETKSCDEDQEGVGNMICKLF